MFPRRSFLKKSLALSGVLGVHSIEAIAEHPMEESFSSYQQKRRKQLWSLLGDLPWSHLPKPPQLLKKEKHPGFTLEHLIFDFNGLEPVPGLLLVPDKIKHAAPGMIYCHAHGGTYQTGKIELMEGRDVMPAYAPVYAEKGIVTLAIDSWCFGERNHLINNAHGEGDTFKQMLWEGRTLFGMMMFDELRALDYLIRRPEVDPKNVSVFGLSMGSTKAWWLAALDERIKACLDLCCLTDFQSLIEAGNLSGHGVYYYVPGLLKYFDTSTINELIVPRPHLSLNGSRDLLTPPKGVEKIRDYLLPLYRKYGQELDCRIQLFDCPHEETAEMRALVMEWLGRLSVVGSR